MHVFFCCGRISFPFLLQFNFRWCVHRYRCTRSSLIYIVWRDGNLTQLERDQACLARLRSQKICLFDVLDINSLSFNFLGDLFSLKRRNSKPSLCSKISIQFAKWSLEEILIVPSDLFYCHSQNNNNTVNVTKVEFIYLDTQRKFLWLNNLCQQTL